MNFSNSFYANSDQSYHWSALILIFFAVAGIVGNLLVCLAISTERRLQSRTNWFLFSLALADMIISGIVIPLAIVKEFTGCWIFGPIVCNLWLLFDVSSCTASIMHIVVISIDRYFAIKDPLNVRSRQKKIPIYVLIILIWTIAILLSSPLFILGLTNPSTILINNQCIISNQFFLIYGSVISFVIPLIIVIVVYILTVYRLKKQIQQCQEQLSQEFTQPFVRRQTTSFDFRRQYSRNNALRKSLPNSSSRFARSSHRLAVISKRTSSAIRNEQKAVKVLGVIFAIFLIAWFPFCILNLLQGVCQHCQIDENILKSFVWLGYVSSCINPLIYTIFNRNFRRKFFFLLQCRCSSNKNFH